jgi:hypothetical protein
MIKNVLQEIGGVGIYAIISLCLFFSVFSTALLWACIQRKTFCNTMSALPLSDGTEKGVSSHE